jgi:hypothetical protein
VDLARRIVDLRAQRAACHQLVGRLPRGAPRIVVTAAKAVCNDIEAELRRLTRRFANRPAEPY